MKRPVLFVAALAVLFGIGYRLGKRHPATRRVLEECSTRACEV